MDQAPSLCVQSKPGFQTLREGMMYIAIAMLLHMIYTHMFLTMQVQMLWWVM